MERLGADIDSLLAVIACSQIVLPRRGGALPRLPAGYGAVDLAMLDWIAVEARRIRHRFTQM
jgi:hypothetical protein